MCLLVTVDAGDEIRAALSEEDAQHGEDDDQGQMEAADLDHDEGRAHQKDQTEESIKNKRSIGFHGKRSFLNGCGSLHRKKIFAGKGERPAGISLAFPL